ncbi:MAG: amidohydrolase family protein [Eggerthellaceae bacterium]|nr:amidohydrolase family protein [Eggerthellaceae bacterium]
MEHQTIIDFHAHLGDIFKDAHNVIYKKGLKPREMPDAFTAREERGFKGPFMTENTDQALREFIDVNHERCRANTLENMQREMDECGVDYVCILPIMPALSFEDYEVAHMVEPRCIPYTCVDYRLGMDAGKKLLEDSERGAYALKLHPVLDMHALDDPLTEKALEYWAQTGKPVTSHCGAGMYYYPEINDQYATPEFGDLKYFAECARRHPEMTFVAAHCGGTAQGNIERLASLSEGLDNLYVDTSFRSHEDIELMIRLFGRDHVMFGTDWPFGSYKRQIEQVKIATEGDQELRDLVFWKTANKLLHIF